MSCYVDHLKRTPDTDPTGGRWRFKAYCRLWAPDLADLHHLAQRIGVKREYFQSVPNFPQYHLTATMRRRAITAGAIPVSDPALCRLAGVLK